MNQRHALRRVVIGDSAGPRWRYLLGAAVAAVTVFVAPERWVSSHPWVFGTIGALIAATAGAAEYGLITGYIGTAAYVAAVGEAAYLASTGVEYPALVTASRLLLVLVTATAVLTVPSYLLSVGIRAVIDPQR